VFAAHVSDPRRYGVAAFGADGRLERIAEKPAEAPSPWAVTGLYLYDAEAPDIAARLTPSARGQLEITDLNNRYLERGRLHLERLARGVAWMDMGTPDSLLAAGDFVRTLEQRQGWKVGCPEEIAFERGWIGAADLERLATGYGDTAYARYLRDLLGGKRTS
jgi:glucose-1-phosphate thymidylyltransferase